MTDTIPQEVINLLTGREIIRRPKHEKPEKICPVCNIKFIFRASPSDVSSGRGKYCSRECSQKSHIKLPQVLVCKQCSKEFPNVFGRLKVFCSNDCKYAYLIGRPIPHLMGERHPFWKGGVGSHRNQMMRYKNYKDWKLEVLKGGICVECGSTENLEADHIVPWAMCDDIPEKRYDIKNGQVLCKDCHSKKTGRDLRCLYGVRSTLKKLVKEGLAKQRSRKVNGQLIYEYKLI